MRKPIATMTFAEWTRDLFMDMAPRAKTVKPNGMFFSADSEEVCVSVTPKLKGYSCHHFTAESLALFYGAAECVFDTEYGIVLEFDSWNKVVDKGGFLVPKRRGQPKGERRQ